MTAPRNAGDPVTTAGCLASLHGRTVAIQFVAAGQERIVKGRGTYERDPELGQVLRISFSSRDDGELVIVEQTWKGQVLDGQEVGCDYLFRLGEERPGPHDAV
jgi:hypothetical protein